MNTIVFDFPLGWQIGLPLVIGILALSAWRQRRNGDRPIRIWIPTALRASALLALVFLVAKPTWTAKEPRSTSRRSVVLLVDRSESMSLEEGEKTRYEQALTFARDHLLPALRAAQ